MAIAVVIEDSSATKLQAGFGIAFRVELYQLQFVRGDMGNKGDIMLLCHGMMDGDKMFILHILYGYIMSIINLLRLKAGESNPATTNNRFTNRSYNVVANRTKVKF